MSERTERIDAFLAGHGFCARRKVADFLLNHKVVQCDRRLMHSGDRIDPDEPLYVNGKVVISITYSYIALHKPIRYLCSSRDDEGRKLAISLIPLAEKMRLYNVGRLDYFSEGLIFFTNDGDFTKKLTHPSYEVEKEYEVSLERKLTPREQKHMTGDFWIDDVKYNVVKLTYIKENIYTLILHEGKNREIRRIFAFLGIRVMRLKRVRIGSVSLGDLALGQYRELTPREISSLVD